MIETLAVLEQVAEPVTWVLLHLLWQATLVAAGLGVVLWVLEGSNPSARYRCACWALLLVVLLPLVTLGAVLGADGAGEPRMVTAPEVENVLEAQTPGWGGGWQVVPASAGVDRALEAARWALFVVWSLGVASLSWLHLAAWWRVRALALRGVTEAPPAWRERARAIALHLGIHRTVRVLQSAILEVPTVVGCLRPVVVLPLSTLTGLEPRLVEAILAHELAHVWRRDALVNVLQVIAETVLFYHPAVWWISGRIREEREHCCDDAAVTLTGDRLVLARALLGLEELRRPALRLAPTAAGGSLPKRIARLLGGGDMSRQHTPFPLIGAALLVSVVAVVGVAWAAVTAGVGPGGVASAAIAAAGPTGPALPGTGDGSGGGAGEQVSWRWRLVGSGQPTRIELTTGTARHRSTLGLELSAGEAATATSALGGFEIRREAGSFHFTGSASAGGGEVTFSPDAAFFADLERWGVTGLDAREKLVIAAVNVDRRWVSELSDLGHGEDLDGDMLVALGIHRVTPEYVRELASAGVEGADLDEVLAMKVHGLDGEWVGQVRAAGVELDADELLAWKIHGIDSEYIESLSAAGFDRLDADEILAMRVHGVSRQWLEDLRSAGLADDVDADEALAMKIHGVTPAFLEELASLGYGGVDPDHLIAMRVHRVDADFIRELERLGYRQVDVEDLVAMKVHDVTADYVEAQQREHGTDISIEDLIESKVLGRSHRH